MLVLWEQDKICVSDLGKRLYLDSGTLTPMLKKMEKRGLINRERSEEDERVVYITLTRKGAALKEKANALVATLKNTLDMLENNSLFKDLKNLLTKLY